MSDAKASAPAAEVKEVNASSATAEDLAAPPEAVQMTDEEELGAAADKDTSDSGKLKTLLGILKRMIGVKDMAAIRLSLPANLLEPVPNLEYWNYLDRGDLFSTIPDFEDPLDRMLATLRFTFTKELKFVRGKVCKPYNSILGEHFRCHWDVLPPLITEEGDVLPRQALTGSEAKVLQQATSNGAGAGAATSGKASSTSGASSKSANKPAKAAATASGEGNSENATAGATLSPPSSAATGAAAASSRPASVRGASTQGSTKAESVVEDVQQATVKAKKGFSKFLPGRRSGGGGGGASEAGSAPPTPAVEKGPAAFTPSTQAVEPPISEVKALDLNKSAAAENNDDDDDDDARSFKSSNSQGETEELPKLEQGKRRITFITEQVSHHPPISSFFVECKQSGVQLCGVDQLSAKFTGTSVRVYSGEQNQGIFVKLLENARAGVAGEEYQILHPTASINGLLRGTLWVAICDSLSVTCRGGVRKGEQDGKTGSRLKAIVEYKDESWVLKAKYALEGVIYEYDEAKGQPADEFDKIRQVPQERVVATFEGSWKGQIWWKRKGEKEARLLLDLGDLDPVQRACRPLAKQEAWESRKIWQPVTKAILTKDYSAATKFKQEIEQKQRDAAVERKKKGEEFVPQFFEADITDGRPRLTAHGREALDGEARLAGYDAPADEVIA